MHKLLPISLLASSFVFSAPAAHAQVKVSVGPVVGETLMRQRFGSSNTVDYRFGLVAGGQAYLSWGRWALQPALLFSQMGYKYATQVLYRTGPNSPSTYAEYNVKRRLNYLTLPLHVVFAPAGPKTGPQFFAGPYVSVLLGGTTEMGELPGQPASSTPIRVANEVGTQGEPTVRPLDAGLQAGVGFRYNDFVAQAAYTLGLRTTQPTYNTLVASPTGAYNRGFQVSVSYLFNVTP